MSQVVTTVEDVLNLGLRRIGYRLRVGSILEGSEAASQALDIYGQTRDELLTIGDYRFAQWTAPLGDPLKQAANYFDTPWDPATHPQPPWLFEYAYPTDCLKVRAVEEAPTFPFDPLPLPLLFADVNDAEEDPPRRVILCNIQGGILRYTRQVTRPTEWSTPFIEALSAALGRRLAPVLTNLQTAGLAARDEAVSTALAREQG